MKKNIEVISLIYKSVDYLHFITNQLKSDNCKVDGWDVKVRLVLNDATDKIIEEVKSLDINYTIYNDKIPGDYYLNRVYRCWNFAGETCEADNICFVNSDMMFSENWLTNLLKHHDGINIPTSRLVESGKLGTAPGRHGVINNLGGRLNNLNYIGFIDFANQISEDRVEPSGLLMPCVFEKERFMESGMYPEGNIYTTGVGNFGDPVVSPGDIYYFDRLEKEYGMRHITVFDSIVYHIQEGEKDE